jgi:hypothetical protein
MTYPALTAHTDNFTSVQVSVLNVNASGVVLMVHQLSDDTVVGTAMLPEEVLARTDWIVQSCVHPLGSEIPATSFNDSRKPFNDLKAISDELARLRDEYWMSNGERFRELDGPHGLVQLTSHRVTLLRFIALVSFVAMTGMWPKDFDRLGL